MDPSSAQEMSSQTLESMLGCTKPTQEKKPRPADQQALKCPRCDSTNTKFCYYNNYSLSQPRYFCKSCRRYWTKGGTLRNVPVGGGCRKNKRSSSSSSSATTSSKSRSQDQSLCSSPNPIPLPYEPSELTLALARLQKQSGLGLDHDFFANTTPNFDILGNQNGFIEASGVFHNPYYSGMSMVGAGGEMGISYEDHLGSGVATSAAVKQEMCGSGRDLLQLHQGENRGALWSFPWQVAGDNRQVTESNSNMGEVDSNRQQNWYGFGSSSSWHGLLNSPLM